MLKEDQAFYFLYICPQLQHTLSHKIIWKLPCLHFILLIQHNCVRMWRECRSQRTVKIFPSRAIKELPKALAKFVRYNMEVERLHNFSGISLSCTYFCSNISAGVWPTLREKKGCCWNELGLKIWEGLSHLHHITLPSFRLWVRRSQYLAGVQGLFTAKSKGFSRTGFWASCLPQRYHFARNNRKGINHKKPTKSDNLVGFCCASVLPS